MTFDVLDDAPTTDPRSSEDVMLAGIVDSLVAVEQSIAALQAQQVTLLVAAVEVAQLQTARLPAERRDREMPMRNTAAEIGAALRMSDRTMQRRLDEAWTLFVTFPATYTALAQGRISRAHATVILDAGVVIDDDDARAAFEQAAVDLAQIETSGRLRALIGSIAEAHRPTTVTERHREARKKRGVFLRETSDGMAELLAVLPAVLAHGIHDRLTRYAHGIRTEGTDAAPDQLDADDAAQDERTMDQLRADVLSDLLLAGSTTAAGDGLEAIRAHVQITVPALTLTGTGRTAATLAGCGPIDTPTARRLAGGVPGWDRVMTDPISGAILAVDRYRPTADLRRLLRIRDEHCRFPGCRMPVWRTDIDHSHDAARGGETTDTNLAHLCRRHHTLKHAEKWLITHLGAGILEWTSPTGRTYIDTPTPTLRFTSTGDPPRRGDPAPF